MRSTWRVVLPILLLAATPLLAEEELNARQKMVLGIKAGAEPKNVVRTPQGTMYFKRLTSAPPEWDKAYFKLTEWPKGGRAISLQLYRKTQDGSTELLVMQDADFKLTVEDCYRAVARTLEEADKAISVSPEKTKIPVTGKEIDWFRSMIDQLKYDLGH